MSDLRIVDADDWKQVYIGDEKIFEGHSLSLWDWVEILARFNVTVKRECVEICAWCEAQFPEGSQSIDGSGVCKTCREKERAR